MHVIPDEDDEESFQPKDPIEPSISDAKGPEYPEPKHNEAMTQGQPQMFVVDLGPITHVIPEDQESTSLNPHDELLRWHYRLGHLSFDASCNWHTQDNYPSASLPVRNPFVWHASTVR